MPPADPLPSRGVLLRHALPDGSSHFDLMLQPPGVGGASLVTFRVHERVDRADLREFEAERLADHRTDYLTYEGPVSGGRGNVRRVAVATCRIDMDDPGQFQAVIDFGNGRRMLSGVLQPTGRWRFTSQTLGLTGFGKPSN